MARGAGRRHRWLSAALFAGVAASATAAQPPAGASAPVRNPSPASSAKGAPMANAEQAKAHAPAPPAELLDWLGRYADSDDGVDPLGFADLEAADVAREQKERHP